MPFTLITPTSHLLYCCSITYITSPSTLHTPPSPATPSTQHYHLLRHPLSALFCVFYNNLLQQLLHHHLRAPVTSSLVPLTPTSLTLLSFPPSVPPSVPTIAFPHRLHHPSVSPSSAAPSHPRQNTSSGSPWKQQTTVTGRRGSLGVGDVTLPL